MISSSTVRSPDINMHRHTPIIDSPTAVARVLALIMTTQADPDSRGLRMLENLDAFDRIGITESAFVRLVDSCRESVGNELCDHAFLHLDDLELVDAALDGVHDHQHRLLVCRLASCIIMAGGHVSDIEHSIYDRMLLRWGYTRSSVVQAILAARARENS